MKRAVLLDRDGTLNRECHYLSDPGQVELLPGVGSGLRRLREAGFGLVVVTNQSGIARGLFDEERLAAIHDRLDVLLAAEDVVIDSYHHCPHHPEEGCSCRKPGTSLVLEAALRHGFVPSECFVIGDKACDVDLARALGATGILVRTGHGQRCGHDVVARAHHVSPHLDDASRLITAALGIEEREHVPV
ncbi:MAG: HAD family hydrolase [Acidobacteriota bacterium]